jgi:PAS domain-containing protein
MTTKPDYESLFRASPYPSLVLDTTLTILDANHAYLKVVDRPAQELLGVESRAIIFLAAA